MQVIPVIDLKNGIAVHAVKGQREHYAALQSSLCDSPQPIAVLRGLLRLHRFQRIYVADLDALTGQGNNDPIIHQLLSAFPALEFWIDQGWRELPQAPRANRVPVLGSESLTPERLELLAELRKDIVLSLDFFESGYCGPPALLDTPALWPERVILMSLARVGSQQGPDKTRLLEFMDKHPATRWIAAGGIRHVDDLRELALCGVHGVLVASALHNGALSQQDLQRIGTRAPGDSRQLA